MDVVSQLDAEAAAEAAEAEGLDKLRQAADEANDSSDIKPVLPKGPHPSLTRGLLNEDEALKLILQVKIICLFPFLYQFTKDNICLQSPVDLFSGFVLRLLCYPSHLLPFP